MTFSEKLFKAFADAVTAPQAYRSAYNAALRGEPRDTFYMRSHRTPEVKDAYDRGYRDGQQARIAEALENSGDR